MRDCDFHSYSLYRIDEEDVAFSFTQLSKWIQLYQREIVIDFLSSDPSFPPTDEELKAIKFREKMVQKTFMCTIKIFVSAFHKIPRN